MWQADSPVHIAVPSQSQHHTGDFIPFTVTQTRLGFVAPNAMLWSTL